MEKDLQRELEETRIMLDRSEMTKYILEQENALLRDNLSVVYMDLKNANNKLAKFDKISNSLIYRGLRKIKNIIHRK